MLAIAAQPGGFILHMAKGGPATPSVGIRVIPTGPLLVDIAPISMATPTVQAET